MTLDLNMPGRDGGQIYEAIRKDVLNYVNMIIGIDAEHLGPDKMWKYKDPQTGEVAEVPQFKRALSPVELQALHEHAADHLVPAPKTSMHVLQEFIDEVAVIGVIPQMMVAVADGQFRLKHSLRGQLQPGTPAGHAQGAGPTGLNTGTVT